MEAIRSRWYRFLNRRLIALQKSLWNPISHCRRFDLSVRVAARSHEHVERDGQRLRSQIGVSRNALIDRTKEAVKMWSTLFRQTCKQRKGSGCDSASRFNAHGSDNPFSQNVRRNRSRVL